MSTPGEVDGDRCREVLEEGELARRELLDLAAAARGFLEARGTIKAGLAEARLRETLGRLRES